MEAKSDGGARGTKTNRITKKILGNNNKELNFRFFLAKTTLMVESIPGRRRSISWQSILLLKLNKWFIST